MIQRSWTKFLALVTSLTITVAEKATTIIGSVGNFGAVNDTGSAAHGFEIKLWGIHA